MMSLASRIFFLATQEGVWVALRFLIRIASKGLLQPNLASISVCGTQC
jgi:hypothetical protein